MRLASGASSLLTLLLPELPSSESLLSYPPEDDEWWDEGSESEARVDLSSADLDLGRGAGVSPDGRRGEALIAIESSRAVY